MGAIGDIDIQACGLCGGGIGAGGSGPMVGAIVKVRRLMVDPVRLNAHVDLQTHFGGGPEGWALALISDVLGYGTVIDAPDELATEFFVCESCLINKSMPVAAMACEAERRKENG